MNGASMGDEQEFLTADEAASMLGIQTASLYAYVSRGQIRSEPTPENSRARRYSAEDVHRLLRRQHTRRNPDQSAEPALDWGIPVLDSSITLLERGRIYYRGHDALDLAQSATIEQVAALLWNGSLDGHPILPVENNRDVQTTQTGEPAMGFLASLPELMSRDVSAYDLRPETVVRQAGNALQHFVSLVAGHSDDQPSIAQLVQHRWTPEHAGLATMVDAAPVLCADHELNASSFTVRCIASTRAPIYAALAGGLSALLGVKHGGASIAVEAMLDEISRSNAAMPVLARRLRSGEHLPGFGHRLYPEGDPRATALLNMVNDLAPGSRAADIANETVNAAMAFTGEHPNLELALVTVIKTLDAPHGSALTLMALGRTVGWVAHAIEEYARNELIRPRAHYVGPRPIDHRATPD
jgi:citrate synthase